MRIKQVKRTRQVKKTNRANSKDNFRGPFVHLCKKYCKKELGGAAL